MCDLCDELDQTSLGTAFILMAREPTDLATVENYRVELIVELGVVVDKFNTIYLEKYLRGLIQSVIGLRVLQIRATEVER